MGIYYENMDFEDLLFVGKLLIVMFGMVDDCFDKVVIYMCVYLDEGVMGLIVNKFLLDIWLFDLLEQLDIDDKDLVLNMCVYIGGFVEKGWGFVLYSVDFKFEIGLLMVDNDYIMMVMLDVLCEIVVGDGLENVMFVLGYVGWGLGQLEGEIVQNGWLICDVSDEIVFGCVNEFKWIVVLKVLGIDFILLLLDLGYV